MLNKVKGSVNIDCDVGGRKGQNKSAKLNGKIKIANTTIIISHEEGSCSSLCATLVKPFLFTGIQRVKTAEFSKSNSESFVDRWLFMMSSNTE